jgi:hypothetical protein
VLGFLKESGSPNAGLNVDRINGPTCLTGSHFQCELDKAPFKSCHSPFKHKMKRGRHSFQVRAVNSDGVVDLTPARFGWRVS